MHSGSRVTRLTVLGSRSMGTGADVHAYVGDRCGWL